MTNITKIKELIKKSDAILIGAGAGLSESAGYHYSGHKFKEDFKDYIKKYKLKDLYTSSFYPFKTEEEKWAYWAKHIYFSYYENQSNDLYTNLYNLVKDKNYFVITTNTDGKFLQNGFARDKVFEVQGRYSDLQCSTPCHNKLYNNKEFTFKALSQTDKNLKIPSNLVPKCPVCGKNMAVNLRCDDRFVEDDLWYKSQDKYEEFLDKYKNKKILLLEFGVGFNTPGIIRFPFEQITFINNRAKLIRFNKNYPMVPNEIKNKTISITDDIKEVIDLISSLK